MKKLLKSFAHIQSGYSFREALHKAPVGNVRVFQAKDINAGEYTILPNIEFSNPDHLLQDGDVLLSIRGSFRAEAIRLSNQKIVASSSVMVIRLLDSAILPEYLALYLNSRLGQEKLKGIAVGATIQSVSKTELASIPILIPPPETQKSLVKLQSNIDQQRKLARQWQDSLNTILDAVTTSTLQETTK